MSVLAIPEVIDYLEELTTLLYEKGYFGFLEQAHNYVDELIDDIKKNLPVKLRRPAPKHFQRYGTELKYFFKFPIQKRLPIPEQPLDFFLKCVVSK
jgi:hypothetical protein